MVLPVGRSRKREVIKQVLIMLRKKKKNSCFGYVVPFTDWSPCAFALKPYGLSTHSLELLMGAKIEIEFFYPIR